MRQQNYWILPLLVALAAASLSAQDPEPVGEEFQVNTYTTNSQYLPAVAVDVDGGFVVVWTSFGSSGTDTSGVSVQARRYDAAGIPMGGDFQVNTYTTSGQGFPSVAVEADGDFVVTWASNGSGGTDTSQASIQVQRYDAAGNPVGGQFQVNTYTTGAQYRPSVAMEPGGQFVVAWEGYGSGGTDTDSYSIQGQRLDAEGNPLGDEFQVNTYTTSSQYRPAVATDADGGFVVVWGSYGSSGTDTSAWSIQGQRFDATGAPVGGEFQVNTYTQYDQLQPAVAVDSDGDFIVVWDSFGSSGTDTSGSSIQGQRFDATGVPVGDEFQVNAYTTNSQSAPAVAVAADSSFVVVWSSMGSSGTDSSYYSIQAQRFSAAGAPVGGQFQVNTYTPGSQLRSEVAVAPGGGLVVVWQSDGSSGTDTSGSSIQGQRFSVAAIFTDGFESGDTSAWSGSVP